MNIFKKLFRNNKQHNGPTIRKDENLEIEAESPNDKFAILQQKHIDRLQSDNKKTRVDVIEELGAIGEPVVQDLIYALDKWYEWSHSDASSLSLRISIARVLGIIGDERAIKPIIKMAGRIEKTVEHREVAAESLALIGKSVIQPMLELLESEAADAQQLSAWTLGKIGDPIAIKYLIPMLSKQPFHYPHVRAAANRALVELTKQDFGEDIELWNNWFMNNTGD